MKEILKELFLTRKQFADKYNLNERTLWGYIRGEAWNKLRNEYLNAIKSHIINIQELLEDKKETYLKDIDLNTIPVHHLYMSDKCKVIDLELDIKHPVISVSWEWTITVEWYLPTSYKDYDKYQEWVVYQQITLLKWYEVYGMYSDKYTLYLTLIKNNN